MLLAPESMHIPDGFLSLPVAGVMWVISALVIAVALRKNDPAIHEQNFPLVGVLAAAIFAAQMLNFAIAGGTSGHLLGAALSAILVGPWTAVLIMTSVVGVQALIFQDGGLLALGANLFNMAVVGVFVSYAVYRLIQRLAGGRRWGYIVGGFAAGWLSVVASALVVGFQLALSGTTPANIVLPVMGGVHALIGIGEGLITAGALVFLTAARPDILTAGAGEQRLDRPVWLGGVVLTLALLVLSPLASTHPDGLEWAAEQAGFLHLVREPLLTIIPDYLLPGISDPAAATILAGIVGAGMVTGMALVMARSRRRSRQQKG